MKETLWCCVNFQTETPYYYFPSLSYFKKNSILRFDTYGDVVWEDCKKIGWKCIKIEVIIKPINEVK